MTLQETVDRRQYRVQAMPKDWDLIPSSLCTMKDRKAWASRYGYNAVGFLPGVDGWIAYNVAREKTLAR